MAEQEKRALQRRRFPSFLEAFFNPEEFFPEISFQEEQGLSVSEDEKNLYVEACLPGLSPQDIQVQIDKGNLWIKGEKNEEEKDKNRKFYRKGKCTFSYYVTLPENVDPSRPEAVTKNGMMTITFPKKEAQQPQRIQVKQG